LQIYPINSPNKLATAKITANKRIPFAPFPLVRKSMNVPLIYGTINEKILEKMQIAI
jgi:hypothetical protein